MRIDDIEKNKENIVVIYPGRFQPWHKGHAKVYNDLKSQFENVYIATSGKTELDDSPFSFDEKREMITFTGVPSESVIQTKIPYQPVEILSNFDPTKTKVIFAVSKKDMNGKSNRFSFEPKKDGTPSYYQPFSGDLNSMKTMDKYGYIHVVPVYEFSIEDTKISSATQVREMFRNANPSEQRKIVKDLYGKYDPHIHDIMRKKLNILNSDENIISEAIDHHTKENVPFRESVLRPGSKTFFDMITHLKENINNINLDEIDREILETDIGDFGQLEDGTIVPLDIPFLENEDLSEAEYKGKNVTLNQPKRGGSKKFYVYVRDPKTKNIKKVSFGDKGLSVKSNDPGRVKSFVARHDCKNKKDKTKAGYWACRAPRYKSLGIKGGQWW